MIISKCIREVILDTETTGLSHENGDRIVEIACVELVNHVPTGNTYQIYVNPQTKMSPGAMAVSGITDEFLADKPLFHEIVDDFLSFVGDAKLVIHNAKFDIGFLNNELEKVNKPLFNLEDAIDTLEIARRSFPGMPVNLDALCRRFNIDTSIRAKHGALIDSQLLTDIYINLLGGRQSDLSFATEISTTAVRICRKNRKNYVVRHFPPTDDEIQAHDDFLKRLGSNLGNV
ncbi:MAG: DNA polymerase III subunit epsilon [Holosporaceae bacterium]|jgi:DNA polymerase-3 subunit epsilon|nr:DNA polymerase III subunit epsilon [Holosporaceae bacterium]